VQSFNISLTHIGLCFSTTTQFDMMVKYFITIMRRLRHLVLCLITLKAKHFTGEHNYEEEKNGHLLFSLIENGELILLD